ncbi:MAG: class F420-dependent oxidoreductase [Solirubrobacterales bacterium]|nr:class F420-dependent oxidoreductase [Solirubrobacterales bacterium]
MADQLEGRTKEIFTEGKNYAHVSIPREDGTVQSVIVWAHADDEGNITLNSAEGRAWPKNLRKAGTATVTLMADGNPYEYVAVTGRLAEDTHEGADEDIDFLAKKYIDADSYPFRKEGEQRILFKLRPERVNYVNQG